MVGDSSSPKAGVPGEGEGGAESEERGAVPPAGGAQAAAKAKWAVGVGSGPRGGGGQPSQGIT